MNPVDLLTPLTAKVVDDLNNPVIVQVANRGITAIRDLVVQL